MFHLSSLLQWRRNAPQWRSLREIDSGAEAEIVSARCRFSLSTVEVMCNSAATFCALVERELPGVWRWAVYGVEDIARAQGVTSTKTAAQHTALKVLLTLEQQGALNIRIPTPARPSLLRGAPTY